MTAEVLYRYLRPSALGVEGGQADLTLSTSGGATADGQANSHPQFFDGFLEHADQAATALLVIARVARSRFYTPPGMVAAAVRAADPVVTCDGERLRFESFSACCGVYARLDLLAGSLDGRIIAAGTTNVDVNPGLRAALAKVSGLEPLNLRVGTDLVVTTLESEVIERKVPLPDRWLKGFAEVQIIGSALQHILELPAVEASRFLRGLPTAPAGRVALSAVPAGRGARLTSRGGPGTVPLSGPERLRVLEPLLRFATALRAYAMPDGVGASVWELVLRDARLVVGLSPDVSRGFSGEGGVLFDLADESAADDAETVSALLTADPRVNVHALAAASGRPLQDVERALRRLGAAGKVGFDCADNAYFHRELPYDADALESMHPRLRGARELLDKDALRQDPEHPDVIRVQSGDGEHLVRRTESGLRCSCAWFAKHQGTRGPCKHILAVQIGGRLARS